MRLVLSFYLLGFVSTAASSQTVSRTIEARPVGQAVIWQPENLELSSQSPNSLRIINRTNKPQCFQIQNLGEAITIGPGETRIVDFPAYQHGRFSVGCPGAEARGGTVEFR